MEDIVETKCRSSESNLTVKQCSGVQNDEASGCKQIKILPDPITETSKLEHNSLAGNSYFPTLVVSKRQDPVLKTNNCLIIPEGSSNENACLQKNECNRQINVDGKEKLQSNDYSSPIVKLSREDVQNQFENHSTSTVYNKEAVKSVDRQQSVDDLLIENGKPDTENQEHVINPVHSNNELSSNEDLTDVTYKYSERLNCTTECELQKNVYEEERQTTNGGEKQDCSVVEQDNLLTTELKDVTHINPVVDTFETTHAIPCSTVCSKELTEDHHNLDPSKNKRPATVGSDETTGQNETMMKIKSLPVAGKLRISYLIDSR